MTLSRASHIAPIVLLAGLLSVSALTTGCQRGEKSCRYYSLVLEKSESADERKMAIREIRGLSTEDQQKCNDDKVFARFTAIIEKDASTREGMVDALESIGKNDKRPVKGPTLRERSETLLAKALGFDDVAPAAAQIVRAWRYEAHERGKTYQPGEGIQKALAAAVRRVKNGEAKGQILQALWLAIPDPADRKKFEDLLIEIAETDPAQQSVQVNLDALKYLTDMRSTKDEAFDAYVHGLFLKDAAGAETYGQARLALSVIHPGKVTSRILTIFTMKNGTFAKWAKDAQLFDWEWQEGPKLAQVLSDLHEPKTAPAIVARMCKVIDASREPSNWKIIKKDFPYHAYITSRLQLSMWGLAAMGSGLSETAEAIGTCAATQGLTVEQRTMPFIALSISGAGNMWPVMIKTFQAIVPAERADFVTPMVYAVEPENLEEWDKVLTADTSEGTQKAIADPTIVGRLNVVRECAKPWAAAPEAQKTTVLANCYQGFLKTGDNLAKEKAALGLVHLMAKGADLIKPLLEAFEKSKPSDSTLRQIIVAGIKGASWPLRIRNTKIIYQTQQRQVQVPNNRTWIWEFDVILNHISSAIDMLSAPKGEKEPAAPAGDAPAGDAPAGDAPAGDAPAGDAPAAAPAG